jgi:hypothetical protein
VRPKAPKQTIPQVVRDQLRRGLSTVPWLTWAWTALRSRPGRMAAHTHLDAGEQIRHPQPLGKPANGRRFPTPPTGRASWSRRDNRPKLGGRRRRMRPGTIRRTRGSSLRQGVFSPGLANSDSVSSRRITVTAGSAPKGVIREYENDSSSKRPASFVAFVPRAPTQELNATETDLLDRG